ncbi:Transcriptional regulator, XRE family [Sulfurovum sp. enrichment culture clone C5]|uniref:Transcriptional regulator, XRE family n=1 Tax=Sulfurovum sp. enrichment culture clone C5 TaxID=497650 RepID=A0A0S4XN60_9BACT|nr:Transcriptional regulator, XRE family [Sulfurovum sp. enrichment culture clone C5]
MDIKPIKNENDYMISLHRAEELLDALPETKEADELEILATLIERYEALHFKIDTPDPIEAIKFRMEQDGLIQKDLILYIGSKSKVSEVLNKKRGLTLEMIRKLHDGLHIPLENLVSRYAS